MIRYMDAVCVPSGPAGEKQWNTDLNVTARKAGNHWGGRFGLHDRHDLDAGTFPTGTRIRIDIPGDDKP